MALRSRFTNVLTLLVGILSFAPVLAVDWLLDSYVRDRESDRLKSYTDRITVEIQASAYDAIGAIRQVLAESPSLCTPTFMANVHRQMEGRLHVKQFLVENADGVQYCDAFGHPVSYTALTAPMPVPGLTETVRVVQLADLATPALMLTSDYGQGRSVSAFVPVVPGGLVSISTGLAEGRMVRIVLGDGTPILTSGDPTGYDERAGSTDFVSAQSYAGELPIRVETAAPFANVRATYAGLDMGFTVFACLMSAICLVLALGVVRRAPLHAFDLERAIAGGELKPYYQPVVNLSTGRLSGCEVLIRWEKRNGEIVMPGAFIDYAEQTGLAIPMTLSLMQQVKADLGELCEAMPEIKVSINLFDGHFRDGMIVEDVQAIFGGSKIALNQLVFEITERSPLNTNTATTVIGGLHALGSRLAMDDAGTGHSNLAYMQTLGVDVIKIDRVFVDMIKPGTTQVPVLDGLIAMARDLGTEIVAEGVETEAQALYLRDHGVVLAQGFLFAPALKAESFKALAQAINGVRRPQSNLPPDLIKAA